MLILICVSFWVINFGASITANRARDEWITMITWVLDQQTELNKEPEYHSEALRANRTAEQIIQWASNSIYIGLPLYFLAQVVLTITVFSVILFNNSYIPVIVIAFAEAATLVYTWIIITQYYRSKGMCYAVHMFVESSKIYNEQLEYDDES